MIIFIFIKYNKKIVKIIVNKNKYGNIKIIIE